MIARIPHLWMVWIKLLIMFCIKTMSKPFIQQNDLVELTLVESMKRGVSYLSASTEITKAKLGAQKPKKWIKSGNHLCMQILHIII
jgi:hypothetical protein